MCTPSMRASMTSPVPSGILLPTQMRCNVSIACVTLWVAGMLGCSSGPLPSDCGSTSSAYPTTWPIYVYISGVPSSVPVAAFVGTATGSKGDKVTLHDTTGSVDTLQGVGQTDETYEVAVAYEGATIYEGTLSATVDGCGFVANIGFAACCLADDGGADSGG